MNKNILGLRGLGLQPTSMEEILRATSFLYKNIVQNLYYNEP